MLSFSGCFVFGQIESGKLGKGTVAKTGQQKTLPNATTMLYLGAGLNHSFRNLQSNKVPFGEPLGQRVNEQAIDLWTFHLGYKQTLAKHFQIDAGLHFDKFGETYNYQDPFNDSAFSYTNRYAFIGLPIQFNLTFGQRLVFSVGGGIQPMLATSYKSEQEITDANKNVTKEELEQVIKVFESFGKVEILEEKLIDIVPAVSGSSGRCVGSLRESIGGPLGICGAGGIGAEPAIGAAVCWSYVERPSP
jgi:hypothetical protein